LSGVLTSERKNWPMPRNSSYETHARLCAPRGAATGILDVAILVAGIPFTQH
jgi:hypothetical protein